MINENPVGELAKIVGELIVIKGDIERCNNAYATNAQQLDNRSSEIKSCTLTLEGHKTFLTKFDKDLAKSISDQVYQAITNAGNEFSNKIDKKFAEIDSISKKFEHDQVERIKKFDQELWNVEDSIKKTYTAMKPNFRKYAVLAVLASVITSIGGFYMSYRYFGADVLVQARYGEKLSSNWKKFTPVEQQLIRKKIGL